MRLDAGGYGLLWVRSLVRVDRGVDEGSRKRTLCVGIGGMESEAGWMGVGKGRSGWWVGYREEVTMLMFA